MDKKFYSQVNETIYEYDHASGLHVQIIPKEGYNKKFAILTVDFGSVNTEFILPGENEVTKVPGGIAHFLEHKLFEQKDADILEQFARLGASANAATSFSRTYYYFTATENFEECFDLLLYFVFNPYLTKENVEKEKGIITQEINMYLDNPYFISSMNLQRAIYHNNPIRNDIAGTCEDVMSIDVDVLKKVYNAFYTPSNMSLVVVGDVNPDNITPAVDKAFNHIKKVDLPKRVSWNEPYCLNEARVEEKMPVAMPIFCIGFKDDNEKYIGNERVRREMAGGILSNMLFGPTSEFYEKMYNKGIINQSFYAGYDIERDFAFFTMGGESEHVDELIDEIKKYITQLDENGLDEEEFLMIRNSTEGEMIRAFNSPESIGKIFGRCYLQGISGFDYFLACGTITFQEVVDVFKSVLLGDMAVSVVNKREE